MSDSTDCSARHPTHGDECHRAGIEHTDHHNPACPLCGVWVADWGQACPDCAGIGRPPSTVFRVASPSDA